MVMAACQECKKKKELRVINLRRGAERDALVRHGHGGVRREAGPAGAISTPNVRPVRPVATKLNRSRNVETRSFH